MYLSDTRCLCGDRHEYIRLSATIPLNLTVLSLSLYIHNILLISDIPDTGLLCDLLWADPDKDIVGWGENDRGVSFTFGEDVVAQFLRR